MGYLDKVLKCLIVSYFNQQMGESAFFYSGTFSERVFAREKM